MIVAVEGIDGAGKNTVVTALAQRFADRGVNLEVLAFPNYDNSLHAQLAREALYGRMGDLADSAYAMATLFALDRHASREVLERFVDSSNIIILDRYVASNAAFSWARTGDEAVTQWVYDLEFSQLGLPVPDLQILLDVDRDTAAQRARHRSSVDQGRQRDNYERDSDLQRDTHRAYELLAEQQWASEWLVSSDVDKMMDTIVRYRRV